MSVEDRLGQALHKAYQSLMQTTAERDDARAEAERLKAERDALRAAARALLDDVESPSGEPMGFCHALRCRRLAMCGDGDMVACDEHQGILVAGDIEDLSYAPAVRFLRSLLPKEGA